MPGIVGVKEASGNISQMVEICGAVPEDFLVLSGDDALTLPLMAVGGRGLISVAGNEVPGEMARMVEQAEQNDFAAARQIHNQLLPLMLVNFIESNPIPVKSAMAALGLLEEVYRLPMVPPREASRAKIRQVLGELKTDVALVGEPFMTLAAEVEALSAAGAATDRQAARDAFARLRAQLSAGEVRAAEPDPSTATGWRVNTWVKQGILLGFKFGDIADMSADHGRWPFFDKDTCR